MSRRLELLFAWVAIIALVWALVHWVGFSAVTGRCERLVVLECFQ